MASNKASIDWATNDTAVVRSMETMERTLGAMVRKLDEVEKSSKKANDTTASGMEASALKVKDFVVAMTGVGSVMAAATTAAQLLKAEWEALKARQQSAADANLDMASVMPALQRASAGMIPTKQLEDIVGRVSGDMGVSQVKVAQALEQALSARGPSNKQEALQVIDTVKATMKFAPDVDPSSLALLVGGAVDLQRGFGLSAEQSVGFFDTAGAVGRVLNIQQQATNMAPAIRLLTQFGASPAEAAGIFGTLTRETGDFTGASSRTAALSLSKQLQDRGFSDPMSGIRAMQQNPELRQRFLEGGEFNGKTFQKATFEAAFFPAIRAMLTGGSRESGVLETAIKQVGTFDDAAAAFRERVGQIGELSSVQIARSQKTFAAGEQAIYLSDLPGAESAVAREGLNKMLAASGANVLDQHATKMMMEVLGKGQLDNPMIADELRKRADKMMATEEERFISVGMAEGVSVTTPRVPSDRDRVTSEVFGRVADQLDKIAENTAPLKEGAGAPRVRPPAAANNNGGGIR